MAIPSVTYSFSNGTTADATQVNQNFTDLVNAFGDGTADITASTLTLNSTLGVTGAATFDGAVTLGNAAADAITVTGTMTVAEALTLSKTLAVTGAATFDGAVTLGNAVGDAITVTGTMTVAEALAISKTVTTTGEAFFNNNLWTGAGDLIADSDSTGIVFGDGQDMRMFYNGTTTYFRNLKGSGAFVFDSSTDIAQNCSVQLIAGEAKDAILNFLSDDGDDNADNWRIIVDAATNHLKIQSFSSGSWADAVDYAPV